MLGNLFTKVGLRSGRPIPFRKWLYWSPTPLFLLLHFYEVKQISGQSMKVCHRAGGLGVPFLMSIYRQLADAQPRLVYMERYLLIRSLFYTHPS